jgi:hypothetical protein
MRLALAVIAATLCAALATVYGASRLDNAAPVDRAGIVAAGFLDAYNRNDDEALCSRLDARYWLQYWGQVSPGACLENFGRGPNDPILSYEILSVTHADGNTALAVIKWADPEGVETLMVFTLELTRRQPSSEYKPDVYAPLPKPGGKRILAHARWQVAAITPL